MYHKKLDKPTETLAEWTKNCNEKKKDSRGQKDKKAVLIDKFDWHKSKYKPLIEQREKTFTEEDTKMTKNAKLINKLIAQKRRIQDNVLRIDTKVINPIGISDYQVKLLTTQRHAMMVVLNILNLRIADLSVVDD
jgi:septal ring factor EnvC (AmiA/AmiB activator)